MAIDDPTDIESRMFYSNRLRWMQTVLADREMPERYKLVGLAIVLRINPPHFVSFPELGTIAEDANVSKSTAIRATKYLEAGGWLFIHRYGNKKNSTGRQSNRYAMLIARCQ